MRFAFMTTLSTVVMFASAASLTITNNCAYQVDPGFYPFATLPNNTLSGGFAIASGYAADVALHTTEGWSNGGRIWGRTGCDADGNCATGGCGAENCTSPAGSGVTLAQFTLDGYANLDYFEPSTTDGFNIPITIVPGEGCTTGAQECSGQDTGNGCNMTSTCPTDTNYYIIFCDSEPSS